MASAENHYANFDLFLPSDVHEHIASLVATSGAGQFSPFDRQIDLWWVGVAIGVALRRRTPNPTHVTKFNVGSILSTDPWRIVHLELLALAEEGPQVLDSPRWVVQIASEYANTGVRWLAERLIGEPEPILALANFVEEFRGHGLA